MKSLLDINRIKVQNGEFALAVENIRLHTGESIAIIGHNGAGKTTLLLALAGLIKVHEIDLTFDDIPIHDIRTLYDLRTSITMLFQEPLLLNSTVHENIALGLKIRKLPASEIKRKVHEFADMFGISHLLHRRSHTLSAGEARRVSLARSLILKPKLLLMDEPFSALDALARDSLLDDFVKMLRHVRCGVIFISHDRDETLRLADRIVVLKNGRVIQEGAPSGIITNPADEFTASFMGVETILSGIVVDVFDSGFTVNVAGRAIEVAGSADNGEIVTLGIRPEHIVISKDKTASSSMRNSFEGKICGITHAGTHVRVLLDCGFKLISYITPHSLFELGLYEGSTVTASFKATAIHILRHAHLSQ